MNNLKSPEAFVVAAVVAVDASAAVALSDAADRNEPDSPAAGDGGASAELVAVAVGVVVPSQNRFIGNTLTYVTSVASGMSYVDVA